MAALGVVDQALVLEASRAHHRRQQHQRLAIGLGLQEGDNRQFGDIEFQVAHHTLERGVGHLGLYKIEVQQFRCHRGALQGKGVRVIAKQGVQPDFGKGRSIHGGGFRNLTL